MTEREIKMAILDAVRDSGSNLVKVSLAAGLGQTVVGAWMRTDAHPNLKSLLQVLDVLGLRIELVKK